MLFPLLQLSFRIPINHYSSPFVRPQHPHLLTQVLRCESTLISLAVLGKPLLADVWPRASQAVHRDAADQTLDGP